MIISGSRATLTKICYDLKAGFIWEKLSYGQWPGDQLKSSPYRDKIMNQDKKIVDYIKVSKQYEKLEIVCKVEKMIAWIRFWWKL